MRAMRQIGTLDTQEQAQRFADFLLTEGITARLDDEPGGVAVWIHDERHVARGREILDAYQSEPDAARFQRAADEASAIRRKEQRREQEFKKNVVDMRRRWSTARPRVGPVTFTVIWLSVLATIAIHLGHDQGKPTRISISDHENSEVESWLFISSFQIRGGMVEWPGLQDIVHGQVWRLVTPIFPHVGGLFHLLFNMYWVFYFGPDIEARRGRWRLIGLIVLTAVVSNLAQYFRSGPMFGGMSGVVYGMIGFVWMCSRYRPGDGLMIPPNLVIFFLFWLFLCMTPILPQFFGIHVANAAHVGGLLAGMAVGYAPVAIRRRKT